MSRNKDSMVSKFDRFRAEYDRSRENRYTRKRDGIAYRGSSADWHYRNEYLYYRDVEVSRQLDMDDPAISAGTTLAVNNIIQDGFMPNPATGDKAVDDELWNRFWDWADDPEQCDEAGESTFHEQEIFVARAILRDGDICATANPSGKLSLWESHEIQTESRLPMTVLGVTMNGSRQRTAYHIRADAVEPHMNPSPSVPVPVFSKDGLRQVMHVYVPKRVRATRGVSAYTPITTIAQFRDDIEFALLVQRQVASCFTIFRKRTQQATNPMATPGYGQSEKERTTAGIRILENIGPGMEVTGEVGEDLTAFSPNIPGGGYEMQHKTQLQLIGINLGLPLCVLFMDGSETNYSGWRGAVDEARKGFRANQKAIATKFHKPVWNWRAWVAVQDDPALARAAKRLGKQFYKHSWDPPAWPYINPMDDAAANALVLQEMLNSPRRQYNGNGRDYETIVNETIEDRCYAIVRAMIAAEEIGKRFPNQPPLHWRELVSVPIKDAGIPTTILNQKASGKPAITPQSPADTTKVADTALNGAQVQAASEIVEKVANKMIPRDSGISQLVTFFQLTPQQAEQVMGAAGTDEFMPAGTTLKVEQAPLLNQTQQGSAEYMQLSRRQLQNNRKAITDALNDLMSGARSAAFTEAMLATFGLSPETVKKLVQDASDGRIDDPDLKES